MYLFLQVHRREVTPIAEQTDVVRTLNVSANRHFSSVAVCRVTLAVLKLVARGVSTQLKLSWMLCPITFVVFTLSYDLYTVHRLYC